MEFKNDMYGILWRFIIVSVPMLQRAINCTYCCSISINVTGVNVSDSTAPRNSIFFGIFQLAPEVLFYY